MNTDPVTTLLAWATPDKDVIEFLMAQKDAPNNQALAMNRNLTSEQITRLLHNCTLEVGVLLASRHDLTEEQMWKLLKSKKALIRYSFLSRENFHLVPGPTDEMVEYAISQEWFNEDCAAALRNGPDSFTPERRLQLFKLADPHDQLRFHNVHMGKPFWPRTATYRSHKKKLENIRERSCYFPYKFDLGVVNDERCHRGSDRTLVKIDDSLFQELLAAPLSELIWLASQKHNVSIEVLAVKIWQYIGPQSPDFYEIFFQMAGSWQGSIPELQQTVHSLSLKKVS